MTKLERTSQSNGFLPLEKLEAFPGILVVFKNGQICRVIQPVYYGGERGDRAYWHLGTTFR